MDDYFDGSHAMRNLTDERGAVAVLTAILLVVLLGMSALVIDVGSGYHERRVLQNGADAAALAVAQSCARGACDTTLGQQYANDNNASNGPSISPVSVCGNGPGLTNCANPPSFPATNYVMVTTNATVSYTFARVLGNASGPVSASAVAAWGGPNSGILPITFSTCEFNKYSDPDNDREAWTYSSMGTWDSDAGSEPYPDLPPASSFPLPPNSPYHHAVIYFHGSSNATLSDCPAGPANSDLPGGFGWLNLAGTASCPAVTSTNNWYCDKTGAATPNSYTPPSTLPTIVQIPIFTNTNGLTGSNGQYWIGAYVSFYLTGYRFKGSVLKPPCNPPDTCIGGWFVNNPQPLGGTVGGPSLGATNVQLIG
jgi:Flp pilus assembly protein TadG